MLEALEESESTTEVEDDLPEFIQEGLRRQAHRDDIESELISLAGQVNAVDYLFIKKLGEFDEHDGWHGEGIRSFAHYLNWKIGMGTVIAREKVRVARALPDLPLIDITLLFSTVCIFTIEDPDLIMHPLILKT